MLVSEKKTPDLFDIRDDLGIGPICRENFSEYLLPGAKKPDILRLVVPFN